MNGGLSDGVSGVTDVCVAPIRQGPNKGKSAKGTWAGYTRHRRRGERPCADCLSRVNESTRKSKAKTRRTGRTKGEPLITGMPAYGRTEPAFRGSKQVVCKCGARGLVNRGLLKPGQSRVDGCVNCR